MDVNSHPEQHEIADPSETDEACASRYHLSLNSMNLVSKDMKQYKEGKNSSYQTIKKIVQELRANKQSRQDITKKTDSNRYLKHEASVAANRMPVGNSQSFETRKELLNIDFKGNMGQLNGSPKDDVLVPEAFLNNECQRNRRDNICSSTQSKDTHFSPMVKDSRGFNNLGTSGNHTELYSAAMVSSNPSHNRKRNASYTISMNESNQDDKIFKSEIFGKRGKYYSADSHQNINHDKTLEFNVTSHIAFHNNSVADIVGIHIESHHDLSGNENKPCRISDVAVSNSVSYWDENFGVSNSSGYHREVNTSNVVGKTLQSSDISDIRSTKYEKIKSLLCRICADEISQHETDKNVLMSIDSLYNNRNSTNLLFHRSTHVPKTTCNTCGKEHAVENSHSSEQRCPDPECKKTFPCRTRFYQHIPGHGQYFKKHCWVCRRKFSEHITDQDSIYICCVCGVQRNRLDNFKNHCILHLPLCFCNLCKEEYHVDDESFHSNEVKCCFCRNKFKCRFQMEKHFESHVKYFFELHRVRKSNEKLPLFRWTFQGGLQVCTEFDFKNRLYSFAGLKVFKCEHCGKRFSQALRLKDHSRHCKALPYKCEICETRFHTIDLLLSHGFVKHAG